MSGLRGLVLVGLLAIAVPAWAQTTFCQDLFTDTNGVLVENHTAAGCTTTTWTKLSTNGSSIDTNAVLTADTVEVRYQQNSAPGTADYSVAVDAIVSSGASFAAGRLSNAGNDWYECGQDNTGGFTALVLRKYVAGTPTHLGGSPSNFNGGTGTYTLTMNGTAISCAKSGGTSLSATDASIAVAGLGGFHMIGSGVAQLDTYTAKTLAGGGGTTVRTLTSTGVGK